MKPATVLAVAFLAAALPAAAQPAPVQPSRTAVCLNVRDIQDASSKDGKILSFKMRDGTIYNNHLRQSCDSLIFGGFAWTVPSTQEVCEDVQTLRAITTGEVCRLGRFDAPVRRTAAAR
ncbi:MAG: hypothetical protein JO256_07305 [Alphaproteobacteria bacterium]|nr:hypothetical protein [Alphaproteobacteria bacterium]